MPSPEDITLKTYQENFDTYKEKTPNVTSGEFVEWIDSFIALLPTSAHIFEIGSAQGRDARYLREKGFTVHCTDIIPQALEELAEDGFETSLYDFRDIPRQEWINSFDALYAKAVFLHATQKVFEESLEKLIPLLKNNSVLCFTFKLGEGEEIEKEKLEGERYFKYYTESELLTIFSRHSNLSLIKTMITEDRKWIQLLFRKDVEVTT